MWAILYIYGFLISFGNVLVSLSGFENHFLLIANL
jgi:hypothetical protein